MINSRLHWFAAAMLVLLTSSHGARAEDGWALPDLWPFDNAAEEAPPAREVERPSPLALPKIELPRLWRPVKLDPPVLNPAALMQPFERLNSATRRFFSGAQSLNPFASPSDPAGRLYDDHATIGGFMLQPRLDP